jgi:hypothetical protein
LETYADKIKKKKYCTQCWQENAKKFLMVNTVDDWAAVPPQPGDSTCAAQCDAGYSSNGSGGFKASQLEKLGLARHECQKCSPQCATCMDNGEEGDIEKCTSCSATHPFMYSPDSKCMKTCGLGYY